MVEEVMSRREELPCLSNELKWRFQDAEAKVSLAKIEKTVIAEWIKTLELDNRAFQIKMAMLLNILENVFEKHQGQSEKKINCKHPFEP